MMPDEKAGPAERPDTLLGQTLAGRYLLTRKIGEGGMGAVYEATHVGLDKLVAVKILRDKYLDRPAFAQRLVKEAKLASAIRNEHIIDITDSGATDDGRTFVVMELLEGESLAELLRREGAIPEARAFAVARQVAAALGAAHARGIVHRDVKPENVFLVRDRGEGPDFVKVVDFGISTTLTQGREGEDVGRLTSTGMVLGTPFYMSPEQARGDEELDHRIDVYALGVILYECLTGEVPFRGPNYLAIASRVLNHQPTSPRALRPELRISTSAEAVVLRAMAKDRNDRYPSMEAFAVDIDRVLAGDPIDAPATSSPEAAAPPAVDEGGGRAWLIALALMLLAGGGALLWAGRDGASKRAPAPTPPATTTATVAPPPAPPAAPAPAMVVLHFETDPAGAEIRQGDRVLGVTPSDRVVPRSEVPAHLTFHLDGYEPGQADIVPLADETVRVKLTRRAAKATRPRPTAATARGDTGAKQGASSGASPSASPSSSARPSARETLPNPY